mgnify:CR=1 FL=1
MWPWELAGRGGGLTGEIATPDGIVVATVSAGAFAIVGEPDGWSMILGARE